MGSWIDNFCLNSCFTFHCVLFSSVAYIELNGRVLPNNSLVTLPEIGTTVATSLRCVTARTDCCSGGTTGGGDYEISEWFDSMSRRVTQHSTFTRSRAGEGESLGYVQLRRLNGSVTLLTADEGIYSCIIPEPGSGPSPDTVTFYVGIYKDTTNGKHSIVLQTRVMFCSLALTTTDAVSITNPIQFTLDSAVNAATPMFTLTCTSTSGPATTVTWTSPAGAGGTESQTVTNMRDATYSNTLTVTGRHTGNYMCNVSNVRNVGSPASQTLTVTGECGTRNIS